ncbi:hypothetical protein SAMN04487928_11660 [Butyrivibrio proteoclasticus]|uniref:Uncharacterized protein n=2 Tax=Butyrivibrio proteoclasticus TaxID=43305 RepID=A0A1I5VB33_9FIRM|nr:hypothetical protein SAMN04487928_11660 [Butyrivibrio proteoclasticus]
MGIIEDYAPIIYMDKKEPIKIKKVGYEIYTENGTKSKSFNRSFDFENYRGAVKVIEYAYYLDYDIQHLYDLEHIWIYIDEYDNIVGAEGSYHGRFLNALVPELTSFNKKDALGEEFFVKRGNSAEIVYPKGSKLIMYSQPGKHAMLCSPKVMYLYTELFESCGRLAGIHGLDAPERYLEDIHITDDENEKVVKYIRENFAFEPSMEFEEVSIPETDYMPWDELAEQIPVFIKDQLKTILD